MPYQDITITIPFSVTNAIAGVVLFFSFLTVVVVSIKIIWELITKNERMKYEFVTIIAHKFRTPLTYIKWAVDELMTTETDSYRAQSLKNVQESNEKLIKLTGTLVELTDADNMTASAYSFERTDLCQFAREVSSTYKDMFHEKNIFFSVQCPATPIFAKIDRSRLEFVLQTLLENARAYTPTGKDVVLAIGLSGRKAAISVTDHGIGIAKDDIPHIFSKFFRAPNARAADTEGFGVGLYLAQSIVERHRGEMTVFSEGAGMGSTFTITLKKA